MTEGLTREQAGDLTAQLDALMRQVESGDLTASSTMLAMIRAARQTLVASFELV